MLNAIVKIAAIAAAIGTFCPHARAEGPATNGSPQGHAVLLLRNGEVIEGRVNRDENVYLVDLPDARIRVKAADVEMVCRNLDEGYRRKRAALQGGYASGHLELAQWCLRHNLLTFAAAELNDASAAEPKHPMIAVLRHRLKMATEPPPPQEPKRLATAGPTNEELDRMVRGLPHGTVELFSQSVQPVLMNHCTGAGCHGVQSESGLRLIRVTAAKSPSRRLTQRNLHAVLQFIDQENPSASKLITAAGKPHGPVAHAIFSEHEAAQFRRLVAWAILAAGREPPEIPATVDLPGAKTPDSALVDSQPRRLPTDTKEPRPMPSNEEGATPSQPVDPHKAANRPPPDAASGASPADPFDPDVFNRRYGPDKPAEKR